MNKILRNEEVTSNLPNFLQNDETPSVIYSGGSAARNTELSYKDFNDLITRLIDCNFESPFMMRNHGRIFYQRCLLYQK